MQWSDIPFDPKPRVLREFSALALVVFGGLAAWEYWGRDRPAVALAFAALALAIGPLGLVAPGAVRPIFVGWMVLAFPIGWVVSKVILGLMYFGIFTPIAVAFRLSGRDALDLSPKGDRASYWKPKPRPSGVRSYFNQF